MNQTTHASKDLKKSAATSRISYAFGAFGHDIFYATLSAYFITFITSHLFNTGDAAQNNRMVLYLSLIHISSPRDGLLSRMPSSA